MHTTPNVQRVGRSLLRTARWGRSAQHAERHGEPRYTGAIKTSGQEHQRLSRERPQAYSGEDDDSLPLAVPGDD